MTDCLIVGFNDMNFETVVNMVRSMGTNSGAYKDLNLAFIEHEGTPYRAMDILNHFHQEGRSQSIRPFHFADFLWPVITYLGTYLQRRGFSFDYVNLFHLEKDKLRDKLLHEDIRTIAVTTTLYVVPQPILEIISFIRQHNEKVKIIVGGPYIANIAKKADRATVEQQIKSLGADFYIFSAEGEASLASLLGALKSGSSLDSVENLAYRNGNHYVFTASAIESNSLEDNLVDYTLFSGEETGGFLSTRTAKSCPFACSFCNFPQQAGKYKYMSVEAVERELNAIRDMGHVTTLTFIDDTFNVPKPRFIEILRMMIRNKYEFKWNSMYRADHGDEQIIELMGKAGCEGVLMGVESASDRMLKIMNKTATRKDYMRAIPLLKAAGILAHANLFIGFPGETYDTVQESVDFIKQVQPETYSVQLWYANPLTPIWNKREEYGIQGGSFTWSHNSMDSSIACDLIDKVFLSIDESTFLPQQGFFQWCLFYLQRKGMSLQQIRSFMRCFNGIIKEKLLYPQKRGANPDLMENLRKACQFDRPQELDQRPIEVFSGANYLAAEQFCADEFSKPRPPSIVDAVGGKAGDASQISASEAVRIPSSSSEDALAAFGVLLWRLNGLEDVELVVAGEQNDGSPNALPVRLSLSWDMKFADLLQLVCDKIHRARQHRYFALQILNNPLRMAQLGAHVHQFETGFVFGANANEAWSSAPQLKESLALVLEVQRRDGEMEARFRGTMEPATLSKLAGYLVSVARGVQNNPAMCLLDIVIPTDGYGVAEAGVNVKQTYGAEVFEF
jgi:radical SAM PhpK family P-methyltransferase